MCMHALHDEINRLVKSKYIIINSLDAAAIVVEIESLQIIAGRLEVRAKFNQLKQVQLIRIGQLSNEYSMITD